MSECWKSTRETDAILTIKADNRDLTRPKTAITAWGTEGAVTVFLAADQVKHLALRLLQTAQVPHDLYANLQDALRR